MISSSMCAIKTEQTKKIKKRINKKKTNQSKCVDTENKVVVVYQRGDTWETEWVRWSTVW